MKTEENEPQTSAETEAPAALQAAIEGLYAAFASYPLVPYIEGCPVDVSPEDEALLHSKPLRELTLEDLRKYAWDALWVWGNEDDFRHFLPRLLELLAWEGSELEPEMLMGKMAYAGWRNWPEVEQASIERYLSALWHYVLARCPFRCDFNWTAAVCLCGVAQAGEDLASFLSDWARESDLPAACHLAQLVNCDGYDIDPEDCLFTWWDDRQFQKQQVIDWLKQPATLDILEKALEQAPEELLPELTEARKRLMRWQSGNTSGAQA